MELLLSQQCVLDVIRVPDALLPPCPLRAPLLTGLQLAQYREPSRCCMAACSCGAGAESSGRMLTELCAQDLVRVPDALLPASPQRLSHAQGAEDAALQAHSQQASHFGPRRTPKASRGVTPPPQHADHNNCQVRAQTSGPDHTCLPAWLPDMPGLVVTRVQLHRPPSSRPPTLGRTGLHQGHHCPTTR